MKIKENIQLTISKTKKNIKTLAKDFSILASVMYNHNESECIETNTVWSEDSGECYDPDGNIINEFESSDACLSGNNEWIVESKLYVTKQRR